jgi:hypothetical protein
MKQRILIILFFVILVAALIGLNAVSYTKKDKEPDSEFQPNRSSYNLGATGTSVFYELLAGTGKKVTRWQQPVSYLLSPSNSRITTLILLGETRREVTDDETAKLLDWVKDGGHLILIDRAPDPKLIQPPGEWKLLVSGPGNPGKFSDVDNPGFLTENITAAKPVQPTLLVAGITAVQPSRLASRITIAFDPSSAGNDAPPAAAPVKAYKLDGAGTTTPLSTPPPAPPKKVDRLSETPTIITSANKGTEQRPSGGYGDGTGNGIGNAVSGPPPALSENVPAAPVMHLSNPDAGILADIPYGSGRIVLLSDPYIVSNAGIRFVDNAILGIDLASYGGGTIAFDEFHQGFGSENSLLTYFGNTPVLAIAGQGLLLIAALLWTRGRRFARPQPLPFKDRRSKLEYIGAMADLQQSSRAYDLAIENIYTQTRRDLIRLAGADNTIQKKALAEIISERGGIVAKDLYVLMSKCEDIIAGEPTNAKETMALVAQLRELQDKLGFNRTRSSGLK